MRGLLTQIPERHFEAAGTVFGLFASVTIATQVYAEWRTDAPSTVSPFYASGFLFIFIFWTFYGVRFHRMALWLTNGIGTCMQSVLLATVLWK